MNPFSRMAAPISGVREQPRGPHWSRRPGLFDRQFLIEGVDRRNDLALSLARLQPAELIVPDTWSEADQEHLIVTAWGATTLDHHGRLRLAGQ